MKLIRRLWLVPAFLLACIFLYVYKRIDTPSTVPSTGNPDHIHWVKHEERYPVTSFILLLESGTLTDKPPIQYQFESSWETELGRKTRLERRAAVLEAFRHSWDGYKRYAWGKDEVSPISGYYRNAFGGWGATMVDTMDSLWIMGLKDEFEDCVRMVEKIDFTTNDDRSMNVFETTIRYLGGLLAAHDLSDGKYPVLLQKAVELGEMLYSAFDTPNRLPMTRWDWQRSATGQPIEAPEVALIAEVGSLSLEFTRLSQLTKDPKYFDAIQRITDHLEAAQQETKIPGLWPVVINAKQLSFDFNLFTLGGMADSTYEYLPKQHLLLGFRYPQYQKLYESAIEAAKKYLFFRPLTPTNEDILFSGNAKADHDGTPVLDPQGQHLACFTGGMVGLASRVFNRPEDMKIARQLTDACIWAYDALPSHLMPETFHLSPCQVGVTPSTNEESCTWSPAQWHSAILAYNNPQSKSSSSSSAADPSKSSQPSAEFFITHNALPPGFTAIGDTRYILRPEAMESLFVLWRLTGDLKYPDAAWTMFSAIDSATRTKIGNAGVKDVRKDPEDRQEWQRNLDDRMESFWLAETLKYAYLIFEEPGVLDLGQWVLNTEAHPFRL